jgi:hypothetical protein
MKNIRLMYIIAGIGFFLLSTACIVINIEYVYLAPNLTIYIPNIAMVLGTTIIFFIISIFMFTIAFICNCNCEEEFKKHLRKL